MVRLKNRVLACVATQLVLDEHPVMLRGLMYRAVSAGLLPSTDREHYTRLGRTMMTLQEESIVPFHLIVYNLRTTEWRSSWAGVTDFADTVFRAYRKDFWTQMPAFTHTRGDRCAELNSRPATKSRRRLEGAASAPIDEARWARLHPAERLERESLARIGTFGLTAGGAE